MIPSRTVTLSMSITKHSRYQTVTLLNLSVSFRVTSINPLCKRFLFLNVCLKFSLQQIRQELLDSQLKVASLQDMSLQLLVNSQGSDCLEAKEKVHVIGNRLKLLLKEVTRDLRELAKILDITSSQQVEPQSLVYLSCVT